MTGMLVRVYMVLIVVLASTPAFPQEIGKVRDHIEFRDPLPVVQDSIIRMVCLMKKLPVTNRVNYFVDQQGFLFVNNTRMAKLGLFLDSKFVRMDTLFLKFSNSDFKSFYFMIHFLKRNNIDAVSFEPIFGVFVFHFKSFNEERFNDIRDIILLENEQVILEKIKFRSFKVLEKRGQLILIAPDR